MEKLVVENLRPLSTTSCCRKYHFLLLDKVYKPPKHSSALGEKMMEKSSIEPEKVLINIMEMIRVLESMGEVLLTPMQVSKMLGLSYNTVWKYIREGRIQAYKVGDRYRIPLKEILKLRKLYLTI
jgi:excisionase family DNA binding protein